MSPPDDRKRHARKGELDAGAAGTDVETGEDESEDGKRQAKAPWHFKFIVVGSVIYLGWRLYQGISWLAHHI